MTDEVDIPREIAACLPSLQEPPVIRNRGLDSARQLLAAPFVEQALAVDEAFSFLVKAVAELSGPQKTAVAEMCRGDCRIHAPAEHDIKGDLRPVAGISGMPETGEQEPGLSLEFDWEHEVGRVEYGDSPHPEPGMVYAPIAFQRRIEGAGGDRPVRRFSQARRIGDALTLVHIFPVADNGPARDDDGIGIDENRALFQAKILSANVVIENLGVHLTALFLQMAVACGPYIFGHGVEHHVVRPEQDALTPDHNPARSLDPVPAPYDLLGLHIEHLRRDLDGQEHTGEEKDQNPVHTRASLISPTV